MNRKDHAGRDLLIVVVLTVIVYVISVHLEVREWMTDVTRPLERYELDELPLAFAALAISLAWFSWRRWRHAAEELRLRIRAQEDLAKSELRYRMLFMEDLAGNALTDANGTIEVCNPAMAQVLGLGDPAEAKGRNLMQFYADADLWLRHRAMLQRGEKVEVPVLELKSAAAGALTRVIARILPPSALGHSAGLHVYFADVTRLHLMQQELADTLLDYRLLSQKYVKVQEEERRGLARELHDELGQYLNAIKLDAVSIRSAGGERPEVAAAASAIVEHSNHVYDAVRGIMRRLRPPALDVLGLPDALTQLVQQWRARYAGIQCTLDTDGELQGLGETLNITVYRLIQECLTNIARHSEASEVKIRISASPDGLRISVHDNGCGMDTQAKRQGLGLIGLRERVDALSGRLELSSTPGSGLEVRVWLPATLPTEQGLDANET